MVAINATLELEAQKGRPVQTVSAVVCEALLSKKPRIRYPLQAVWHIRKVMPPRLLDALLRKKAGLIDSPARRG
jgi:hypothetical protein